MWSSKLKLRKCLDLAQISPGSSALLTTLSSGFFIFWFHRLLVSSFFGSSCLALSPGYPIFRFHRLLVTTSRYSQVSQFAIGSALPWRNSWLPQKSRLRLANSLPSLTSFASSPKNLRLLASSAFCIFYFFCTFEFLLHFGLLHLQRASLYHNLHSLLFFPLPYGRYLPANNRLHISITYKPPESATFHHDAELGTFISKSSTFQHRSQPLKNQKIVNIHF